MTAAAPPAFPAGEPARSLRLSIFDGCANAVQLGAGEVYLVPCAVALDAGSLLVALLGSVPMLAGAVSQLVALGRLDRAAARRPQVIRLARAQALVWLPMMAVLALTPEVARWLQVPLVLAYFALGAAALPAWTSWMGDLVPADRRGAYFGRRERFRVVVNVAAVLGAGALIESAHAAGAALAGFAAVFGVAGAARWLSASVHTRVWEPPYAAPLPDRTFPFRTFLRRAPGNNFGRFALLLAAFHLAVNLSAPFFTLYMLRDLGFSYLEFTLATLAAIGAQAIGFAAWAGRTDRFGNRGVLVASALGAALLPLAWLLVTGPASAIAVQALGGVAWSGVLLASGNFLYDAVMPDRRARCAAYLNALVNTGLCVGALAGGAIAWWLPERAALVPTAAGVPSKLPVLFALSGGLRVMVALAMAALIREVRATPDRPARAHWLYLVGTLPLRMLRLQPLLPRRSAPDAPPAGGAVGPERSPPR